MIAFWWPVFNRSFLERVSSWEGKQWAQEIHTDDAGAMKIWVTSKVVPALTVTFHSICGYVSLPMRRGFCALCKWLWVKCSKNSLLWRDAEMNKKGSSLSYRILCNACLRKGLIHWGVLMSLHLVIFLCFAVLSVQSSSHWWHYGRCYQYCTLNKRNKLNIQRATHSQEGRRDLVIVKSKADLP